VDLCPVLASLAPGRHFVVTDRRRVLYHRACDACSMDMTAGEEIPELPELDAVRRCLEEGRSVRVCVPHLQGGLEIVALPVHDGDGRLRGCFAVFEPVAPGREDLVDRHRRLVRKLSALHHFNASLGLLGSEHDLWQRAVQAASGILGYEYCAVLLHDELNDELVLRHSAGYSPDLHQMSFPLREGRGITAHAFVHNRIISVPDVQNDPRYVEGSERVRSELAIPVVVARRPVGVFSAASASPGAFSDEEVKLCVTLVNQLSLALERLRLFGQVGASRDVLIFSLARLAESRDGETGGHLERICGYTRAVARTLWDHPRFAASLDEAFLEDLYRSAALHDIGKVGIPDSILQKKGRLTSDEFEVMKTHTVIGGETLADAEKRIEDLELLRIGKAIAYYHHEKWDGSGYPYGLAGEEIPVAARIVGLADVYDALTTKRCYKEAYSHQVAHKYITAAAEQHFDPDVVAAFVDCEDEILRIKARYEG
jgi:HD-GYP domain-containing protein (c-di-GMP phosphodiesterase class II)